MGPFGKDEKKPSADDLAADFYELEVSRETLNAIRVALDKATPASTSLTFSVLKRAREAVAVARPMADELPRATLPWEQVEAEARRQGIGVADVIWDARPTSDENEASS